ncbi:MULTISPECIES: relaxase/mobilization nuclease domain-containing protein [unclassified Tolypothrix]|uniref:relaxase/mobilization nuclease domain-containing protein n=1 Tax=unclassified Tolypothrix TaxID=2649714 RepID=UPI0005EAB922|nr:MULTISPECIES: relaxase/mobilization nuclease domain-containing protein [unclassified Tolypothrix]BAY95950.1 relaxase/mobilization nuclease family protein [Microchaete diplosiphon NIES-3275]EKE96539.1 plasmid mobilization protein, relaxase [Tolypothrix sp. PCC 7601]MBE9084097.1 relaxase/mobilization nuclease domain-containing protein [Tolypothrix sp. LEGE 11397]UYD31012.1 relaxase/mobilization nuclease domain-containing protein [Tolypothrix sp. PCC 7712]UYD38881.1 relaxase/mobilization nucle
MIGNQTKGRGFRGLLDYLQSQEDAKLIGGNMGGNNAIALAREFKISRQLNPEADRVVYHASLSLPENERLDDETWNEIANRYLEEMGFDSNQYVVCRHNNTQHDHIHICASRIRLDNGKIVHDSWDYKRSETIIRQIERDYGLQPTLGSHEKLSRNPSIGQQRRLEREQQEYLKGDRSTPQEPPIKQQLQELIDRATADSPTMPQLIERLQIQGVKVRHGLTRNGKSKGISYSMKDQQFSGTTLGAAYTFPGLQKHKSVDYQPKRDDQRIISLLLNPAKSTQQQTQIQLNQHQEKTQEQPELNSWQQKYQQLSLALTATALSPDDRDKKIICHLLEQEEPTEDIKETIKHGSIPRTQAELEELLNLVIDELEEELEEQLEQPRRRGLSR